jgi:hypothetical protein
LADIAERQRLIAKTVPFLEQQKLHLLQALGVGHWFVRIGRRAHQHKILIKERELAQAGFRDGQGRDDKIQPGLDQFLQQGLGDGFTRAQFQIGQGQGQAADDFRQKVGGHGRDDTHAQLARKRPVGLAGEFRHRVDLAQDLAGANQEIFAQGRQTDLARAPFDQRRPKHRFQLLDLHGKGRLRDRAGLGGASEMPQPGQGIEITEVLEGEVYHNLKLSRI